MAPPFCVKDAAMKDRLNRREFLGAAVAAGLAAAGAAPVEITVRPSGGDATGKMQRAFDECFRAGGGTVVVERGEYAVKGLQIGRAHV